MNDTKEQILIESLRLFAAQGYEAVSVSMIAAQLGLTKGALYRHYESKQAIFDAILARMTTDDSEKAEENGVPANEADETIPSPAEFVGFSREMFRYWTEEAFPCCFRRMLTLEQYRSDTMRQLHRQFLSAGPFEYTAKVFAAMGIPQPQQTAREFFGPMTLLYSLWDHADDKASVLQAADEHFAAMQQRLEREYHAIPS